MRALACGVAALVLFVGSAPPALARYEPLASGSVTLTIDPGFASFLERNRIELGAVAPTKGKGKKFVLPVEGGRIDPTLGKGDLETAGSLAFRSAGRRLPLRSLVVKANRVPLSAKVGGGQLKVASTRRLSVSRSGFGSRLTSSDLALTAKAATRLNKKLRPEAPFTAGQAIGRIVAKAQPATIAVLPKGKLSLVPAPEILSKFRSLFVSLNPIAPAELAAGPVFTFPLIADGSIAPDASTGEIRVGGELEFLQLSGGQVFWYEDWFDLGTGSTTAETILQPSPPYAGKLGRIGILGLSPNRDAVGDPGARTVTVNGQILTLTPATASSFNELFAQGDPVFQPGETFGTIAFQAAGQ